MVTHSLARYVPQFTFHAEGTLERIVFLDIGAADLGVRFCMSGRRQIEVTFNGMPVLNATISVYHGPASPLTSLLEMTSSQAGEAMLRAVVSDECANPVTSGVGLRLSGLDQTFVYSPVSEVREVFSSGRPLLVCKSFQVFSFSAQVHAGDGVYVQVLHDVVASGDYSLELLYRGSVVTSKQVVIHAGLPDSYFSTVGGSGLGNDQLALGGCSYASPGSRYLVAGISYDVRVVLRDSWNNSCGNVSVVRWDDRFADHVTSAMQVRGNIVDIEFRPRTTGIDLPFNLHADGSTVFATVATIVPGPPNQLASSLRVNQSEVGDTIAISVRTTDGEGNPFVCCCESIEILFFFTDRISAETSIAKADARVYIADHEEISVTAPSKPGVYSISIQAGDLKQDVSSQFTVLTGAVDPGRSYLVSSRAVESIDLLLFMVDRFNNPAPSLASITNITVIPPASVNVSVGASDVLITIANFTRAGEHLVYVSLNFEPISTFPLRIDVDDEFGSSSRPNQRGVSHSSLIAMGVALAACGVFGAGLCGCRKGNAFSSLKLRR